MKQKWLLWILVTAVLTILLIYIYYNYAQEPKFTNHYDNLSAKLSESDLTPREVVVVRSILNAIQDEVNIGMNPNGSFIPMYGLIHCYSARMTPGLCRNLSLEIKAFLDVHKLENFELKKYNSDICFGATHPESRPLTLFFCNKFFAAGNDDMRRTIIHELVHLMPLHRSLNHGDTKNCKYYRHPSLKAEYCLTSIANFLKEEDSYFNHTSSSNNSCIIH